MPDELPDVDPIGADELVRQGAVLLDVREPFEFVAGHAPSAILLPLSELENRLSELSSSVAVVCVCRSGGRSSAAAEILRSRGFLACNLLGGMQAWASEGLPVMSEDGGSGTVL